jgi:ArsR family transcriptional regulator
MSADLLQKIFKTLGDPTRVRILHLLEREELAVQELMEVLGMAQSRVSRHLGILRDAGLLRDRRDGTFVLYRFSCADDGPWRAAWDLTRAELAKDPACDRDLAALGRVIAARAERSRSFFDEVGPEWDALRKVFNDDVLRARALNRLVPPDQVVADIGTGTGVLALELAAAGLQVIGLDHSRAMLDAAREKIAEAGAAVELRQGDATALPFADAEVDAAFAHMVLQYLAQPAEALAEMARITRPGGSVVLIDFVSHYRAWMRDELGVVWLGFAPEEIESFLAAAGLQQIRIEVLPPTGRGSDLPSTFIASGLVPGEKPHAESGTPSGDRK